MRQLFLLTACLAVATTLCAQELSGTQKVEMLDCTVHGDGQWVDRELYSDGKLRFTYIFDPMTKENSRTLYVAFWNQPKTKGKLLEFNVFKSSRGRDGFAIVNDGWIRDRDGVLDVEDTLAGIYTHEKIKASLNALKQRHVTLFDVKQLKKTQAVCSSPLTK